PSTLNVFLKQSSSPLSGRGGCMRRFGTCGSAAAFAVLAITFLPGCGSGTPTDTGFQRPTTLVLSPSADVSLELGKFQAFTATARDKNGTALTLPAPIFFSSSDNNVVQIAANGLACAGRWDSLSNPTTCTQGSVGTAVVTASSMGVASQPATIHVHQ